MFLLLIFLWQFLLALVFKYLNLIWNTVKCIEILLLAILVSWIYITSFLFQSFLSTIDYGLIILVNRPHQIANLSSGLLYEFLVSNLSLLGR